MNVIKVPPGVLPWTCLSPTSLSTEKSSNLLQSLVGLKDRNVDLPEEILKSVNNALQDKDKETLVKDIDFYLHVPMNYKDDNDMKFMTLKTIVELCPEFLATKDFIGRLPIDNAAQYATQSSNRYLKLYIDVGLKHNIGGEDARGSLVMPDKEDYVALRDIRHHEIFEMLQQMSPPLFYVEDIQKFHLLHNASKNQCAGLVKYFCDLDPSSVHQKDGDGKIPLHYWHFEYEDEDSAVDTIQYLIQTSLSNPTSNDTIGGLFTIEPDDDEPTILRMVENDEMQHNCIWDCIERALLNHKKQNDLPCILHQTIKHIPLFCSEVLRRFPASVHVRDKNNMNRLPIHVALETGMKWSLELEQIIANSQEYLKEVDPVTKWPPFLLARMGTSCDLRTIYCLLHEHPEHGEMLEDGSGYKYITFGSNHKRRKMNE